MLNERMKYGFGRLMKKRPLMCIEEKGGEWDDRRINVEGDGRRGFELFDATSCGSE